MLKDLRGILLIVILMGIIASCSKYEDPQSAVSGDSFTNAYCNDPEAVNYNNGFPGKPDNSQCFYPTDVFAGTYAYEGQRSYSYEYKFAGDAKFDITLKPVSRTKLGVYGVCPDGAFLSFTADRFYRAVGDSTFMVDSIKMPGQIFCGNIKDTLTGIITRTPYSDTLTVSFTVVSDTGILYHTGRAIKKK